MLYSIIHKTFQNLHGVKEISFHVDMYFFFFDRIMWICTSVITTGLNPSTLCNRLRYLFFQKNIKVKRFFFSNLPFLGRFFLY